MGAPLRLTDAQLRDVRAAAFQLPVKLRHAYLCEVADALAGTDFDDGTVHRAARSAAGRIIERYRGDRT
jgi:hypothetical protein